MNRSILAVAGLLGSLSIGACSDAQAKRERAGDVVVPAMWNVSETSEEAAREVRAGVYLLDVGRPAKEAHEHFQRAIAADPAFAFGYVMAAHTAPSLQHRMANWELARQRAKNPSEVEQILVELQQRQFRDDWEGGLEAAERLLRLDPEHARSWLFLGHQQATLGRVDDARKSYGRAAELAPDLVAAPLSLANSYLVHHPIDPTRAEEQIQRAIRLAPTEGFPYDLLGDLRRAQGKLDEAITAYSKAIELNPRSAAFVQQRGHVHLLLGNLEKALADYDAAVALATGNEKAVLALSRSRAFLIAGDQKVAVQELEQLIAAIDGLGVEDPVRMKWMGLDNLFQASVHYGDFPVAERAVARMAELGRMVADTIGTEEFRRAREADIAILEGLLAARTGDYARANQRVQEFMRLTEQVRYPRKHDRAHLVMGMVALRQGKHTEAVKHFDQAHPWKASGEGGAAWEQYVAFHRALALEGAGRNAEAQQLFREIAEDYRINTIFALVRNEAKARLKA